MAEPSFVICEASVCYAIYYLCNILLSSNNVLQMIYFATLNDSHSMLMLYFTRILMMVKMNHLNL